MQAETIHYGKKLEDVELLRFFWQCKDESEKHFSKWRTRLPRLFAMYGGRMFNQEERDYLRSIQQPAIEFNFALGTLNAILGQDMANRSEVIFRGEDLSWADGYQADWMSQLAKHYMNRCKGLPQEWDALHEMLCSGYGWASGFLNVNVIPLRGEIERVHCWEMYPDPDASAANLTDMRFLIRKRRWTLEEAEARWPGSRGALRVAAQPARDLPDSFPKVWRHDEWRRSSLADPKLGLDIYEFQYRRYEPYVRFWDAATGGWLDLPEAEWNRRMKAHEKTIGADGETPDEKPEGYTYPKECFYRAFIAGEMGASSAALQHNKLTVPSFTYNCVTGFMDKDPQTGRCEFFGPAQVIYDAQHYINRSLRLILEILGTSSKGGGFIERSALASSPEAFRRDYARPGAMTVVADEAITGKRIMLKQPTPIPPVISEFLRLCMDALGRLTGVTDYVKGTATTERSNVLISNLQQQSMTLLLPLFEPLQQFRVSNGVLLVRVVLKHLPAQELDRILGAEPIEGLTHTKEIVVDEATGQESEELVPISQKDAEGNEIIGPDGAPLPVTAGYLLKQRDPLEYDVSADVGQASPTMKFMVWTVFSQTELLQIMKDAGMPIEAIMPRLLRYLPIPTEMAQKLADDLEAATGDRPLDPQQILEALAALHPQERLQIIQQAQAQDNQAPPPAAAA